MTDRRYSYSLTIEGRVFNISPIVDSSSLSVMSALCSTKKKSAKNNMSVSLKGGANPSFYATFMQALLESQADNTIKDSLFIVTDTTSNTVMFSGYLDSSEIEINSKHFPDSLELSAMDKTMLLDNKIRVNQHWENTSRNQIVKDLIDAMEEDTGKTISLLSTELSDTDKIGNYSVTEDMNKTYRDIIDLILFEAVGYVIVYDPQNDGYRIKRIPTALDKNTTYRQIKYMVGNGLKTKSVLYKNDGILLSYPTIVTRQNTNLYFENISLKTDDNGKLKGDTVYSGQYYPKDGDVKAIHQNYRIADRPYVSGESRLQNEDLKLLYAKDVKYDLASNPQLSLAPALPNIDWDGTPKFYPNKAWVLFRNDNSAIYIASEDTSVDDSKTYYTKSGNVYTPIENPSSDANPKQNGWYEEQGSNVTTFSLTGTAIYVDYMNKLTVPNLCQNPEEYEVQTITDAQKAKAFAQWYYNSQRYGGTTSQWNEPEGYSTLGEIVYVVHKETGIQMPHVIVQMTDECAGGASGTIRMKKVVAISLYGWQEYTASTVTANRNGSNTSSEQTPSRWTNGKSLWGETTARGWEGNVGDYYLNTENYNLYRCTTSGTSSTALWTYVGNIKGADADINANTYTIEYSLSTSPSEYTYPFETIGYTDDDDYGSIDNDPDSSTYGEETSYGLRDQVWTSSLSGWYKGLYVWQRLKTIDADGEVTYGEPTYCKETTEGLIKSATFELVARNSEFQKNLASPDSVKDTYSVDLVFNGFSEADANAPLYSISVTHNGSDQATISNVTYTDRQVFFTVKRNTDATEISVTVIGIHDESILIDPYATEAQKAKAIDGCIENSSAILSANDISVYNAYGGVFATIADAEAWFNQKYGGVYEGYSFILANRNSLNYSDIVIKYYGVNGQWNNLSIDNTDGAGRILAVAEKDFWSLYDNASDSDKEYLWNTYGYKKEIISHAIATAKIIMYGEGVIASENISTDTTEDLDSDGKYLVKDGYRFEGRTGILRAKSGYFNSINIGEDSNFDGTIKSKALETFNGNTDNKTYSGNNTGNTPYWSYAELSSLLPSTSIVSSLGSGSTFKGHSVTRYCHMTDLNQIYAGDETSQSSSVSDSTFRDSDRTYTYTVRGNATNGAYARVVRPCYRTNQPRYYLPRVELYLNNVLVASAVELASTSLPTGFRNAYVDTPNAQVGDVIKVVVKACTNRSASFSVGWGSETVYMGVNPTTTYTENINQYGLWLYDNDDSKWLLLPTSSYQSSALSVTLNGTTVANKYYTWENDCKTSGVVTPIGSLSSITNTSVSINGVSKPTMVSVSWNENGITFTDANGVIYPIFKGSYYLAFSFSFTGTVSASYTKVENLLPKTDDVTEVGSTSHYFNNVHTRALDFNGQNVARVVVAFANHTDDNDDLCWYRKWDNGFIEQGGLLNGSITSGADVSKSIRTYTFRHPFTSPPKQILCTLAYPNFTGDFEANPPLGTINEPMPYNVTATGFNIATIFESAVYKQIDRPFYWYACGF